MPTPKKRTTIREVVSIEYTEDELKELIAKASGLPSADVEFDISLGGYLRSAIVTSTTESTKED